MSYNTDGRPLLFPANDHRGSLAQAIKDTADAIANYDFLFFFPDTMSNSQLLAKVVVPRAITLPAGLTGSVGKVGTNATAQSVLSVQRNGVEVATITIATNGVVTFTCAVAVALVSGDVLSIVAPNPADVTLADVVVTLVGSLAS